MIVRQIFWASVICIIMPATTASLPGQVQVGGKELNYPPGPLGEVVKLGEQLVKQTNEHPLAKPYVGNQLKCTSCHLDAGQHPAAGSFIDVATAYPAWAPREQQVITLEDRVRICFARSQNGQAPERGSQVSVAITAYITWLSTGGKIQMNAEKPLGPRRIQALSVDAKKASLPEGKQLYIDRCADCHSENGLGSPDGPPVWGENSYNEGAGLAKVDNLAAWLKVAMPLGDPDLTDQQAIDIAAYINSHARPTFVPQQHGLGAPTSPK